MQRIIYDVAVSADGFIAGPDADIARFPPDGPIVAEYLARLTGYGTVLMGRGTYAFGVDQGVPYGANPYPGMAAFVVSTTLDLPEGEVGLLRDLDAVARVKAEARRPVYLCGGGVLASAMAARGMIDEVVLKRAPILLGGGTPLWGGGAVTSRLLEHRDYGDGLTMQRYALT